MEDNQEVFDRLKKQMSAAYQAIGLSRESRFEEGLDEFYLRKEKRNSGPYRFLHKLRTFSLALPFPERQVLINSVLEPSYHYRFWHLQFFSPAEYRAVQKSLAKKIMEAFPA